MTQSILKNRLDGKSNDSYSTLNVNQKRGAESSKNKSCSGL